MPAHHPEDGLFLSSDTEYRTSECYLYFESERYTKNWHFRGFDHGDRMTRLEDLIVESGFKKSTYHSLPYCDLFDIANKRRIRWNYPGEMSGPGERRVIIKALQQNDRSRYTYLRWSLAELTAVCKKRGISHVQQGATRSDYIKALIRADKSQTFPFLDLPSEIRNQVYEAICVQETTGEKYFEPSYPNAHGKMDFAYLQAPLVQTSRQIRDEAIAVFCCNIPIMVFLYLPDFPDDTTAQDLEAINTTTRVCVTTSDTPREYNLYAARLASTSFFFDIGLPAAAQEVFRDTSYRGLDALYAELARRYNSNRMSYSVVVQCAGAVDGVARQLGVKDWRGIEKHGIKMPPTLDGLEPCLGVWTWA